MGKIGGDVERVRLRLRHILSAIDKDADFRISDVHVRGSASSSLPPIYEVVLEEAESAIQLRETFKRFTRRKSPVPRPAELDEVGVFNSVTLATRVRISILRVSLLFIFVICFLFLPTLFSSMCFPIWFVSAVCLITVVFLISVNRNRVQASQSKRHRHRSGFCLQTHHPGEGVRPAFGPFPEVRLR